MERPNPYQPENAGVKKPDPQQAPQEGGIGSRGILPTIHEQSKPPPEKSALNRAVERTRTIYERNGWVFLPLGEVGKDSPMLPFRPPATIFSAPSHTHLLEEPKNPAKIQPPQEAGTDSPTLPQPQSEPKRPSATLDRKMRELLEEAAKDGLTLLDILQQSDTFARALREWSQGHTQEAAAQILLQGLKSFDDSDPRYADFMRKKLAEHGYPTGEHISSEDLQGMIDLPSSDEPPSEDKQ